MSHLGSLVVPTFLVLAINRVKDRAAELGLSQMRLCKESAATYAGFDLESFAYLLRGRLPSCFG